MKHICPLCNGFQALHAACRTCGESLDDAGRLYDYYGDYSPYRPIEDSKLSNGFPDAKEHLCIHMGWCRNCNKESLLAVHEWSDEALTRIQPVMFHTVQPFR